MKKANENEPSLFMKVNNSCHFAICWDAVIWQKLDALLMKGQFVIFPCSLTGMEYNEKKLIVREVSNTILISHFAFVKNIEIPTNQC